MRHLRLFAVGAVVVAILGVSALMTTGQKALAYGAAEQPLAQIELSANCNDPSFGLCQEVGLGGIWLWIEVDAGGTGDIAGAGCGHLPGAGGGAGSIRGEITWTASNFAGLGGAFVFGIDPNDSYYLVTIPGGESFAFPMTVGHYSLHPVPAVTIQLQVAP